MNELFKRAMQLKVGETISIQLSIGDVIGAILTGGIECIDIEYIREPQPEPINWQQEGF